MNNEYMEYMISEKMSQHTIRAYTSDINSCLEFIGKPENEINYGDLVSWKASIVGQASATVSRKVVAVKKYFEYLADINEIDSDPAVKLKSVKAKNKEKTPLAPAQIRAMIDCADKIRSKAIITLLASTGMRISEMINLTIEQYNSNPITITGKGDKKRVVYLTPTTRDIVDQYLVIRGESEYNNVFLSSGGQPMQANNVSIMLKNTARKASIENWNDISNHWLRTTAATMQSEAGQPIEVIQKILGHSSVKTTMRYVKVNNSRVESAMTAQLF